MATESTRPECVPPTSNIQHSNAGKDSLLQDYSVLPLEELRLYDYNDMKRLSLVTNSQLASRWRQYKDELRTRHKTPATFPQRKDIHFYNGNVVYNPSLSTHHRPSYKYSMRHGPGTDHLGVIPIPHNSLLSHSQKLPRKPAAIFEGKMKPKATATHAESR